MNWFTRLFNRVSPEQKPWARFAWPTRGAGIHVTHDVALQLAAVWSCVRIISETIATLGWHVLQVANDGTQRQESGSLNWILNIQANPEMTAFSWRELALSHVLLWGNHYSEIQRDSQGRPMWLWPLDPQVVSMARSDAGDIVYKVRGGGEDVILPARDVLHIHGLGGDGLIGYSVIAIAAQSLGMSYVMDQFNASFYANGTHVGMVLQHPGALKKEAKDYLLNSINEKHQGGAKAFRAVILEEGMTLAKATMPMTDAQFLEQRKFQVTEICRIFRVPPHKVADLDRATFANIEHQSIEFVQDTILPWCRRLEQEVDVKLIGVRRQGNVYTRLNIDTLLRGDIGSRYTAYAKGRQWGWLSINDVRGMERLDPIGPEGDIYLQPLNMVPAGTEVTLPEPPDPGKDDDEEQEDKADNVVNIKREPDDDLPLHVRMYNIMDAARRRHGA